MNQRPQDANPYTSPQADTFVSSSDSEGVAESTLLQVAKRVFLDWEKMRLIYIGVLVAFTLLVGFSELGNPVFWGVSIVGAIIANLCYFLGPIVDTYVSWLGFRSVALRWTMFVLGTLLTMAGVLVTILTIPETLGQIF